eukprot:466985-Hanusia_phi.AAC.1
METKNFHKVYDHPVQEPGYPPPVLFFLYPAFEATFQNLYPVGAPTPLDFGAISLLRAVLLCGSGWGYFL